MLEPPDTRKPARRSAADQATGEDRLVTGPDRDGPQHRPAADGHDDAIARREPVPDMPAA